MRVGKPGRLFLALILGVSVTVGSGCSGNSGVADESNLDQSTRLEEPYGIGGNQGSSCDPNYGGGCVPMVSYDLDCPDVTGPVFVVGQDVHRFDRDRNGIGCEPYP